MGADDIFTYVAYGVALLVVGFIVYQIVVKRDVETVASIVPVTLSVSPVTDSQKSKPVVQNEERVTWTDWLGRERVITISRKVH